MTKTFSHKQPYPLGAHVGDGGVRFSFVSRSEACGILLYDRQTGILSEKIPFAREDRVGNVYCRTVEGIDTKECTYLFYEDDRLIPDSRGRVFPKKVSFGRERTAEDMKAGFLTEEFDWGDDRPPRIPYSQAVGYCLHVRGFTRHSSSKVEHRGTFAGIKEKIPYLKEIGVTTLELQPAYEFMEIPLREDPLGEDPLREGRNPAGTLVLDGSRERNAPGGEMNYWGYKEGYYYAPKAAYAASSDAAGEFRELVKALHENRMELVMQFYFPDEAKRSEILDILCFWMLEYHVDGFHLLGGNLPVDMLAKDDALADTKLWYYGFDTDKLYKRNEQPPCPHLAEYNDAWYYDMRRFLKGDGNMLGGALYHMRHIPQKAGRIHYMSNYSGFTLADMVSYDYKHNEANGEENRDGSDYNCSWNCGDEGTTRRHSVRQLRLRQIKNAMCFILLSQSTPLIFMGDEFGNSQKGNNNPYCQDNAVTWLDWRGIERNARLHAFWKMLVRFRQDNPILRPGKEHRLMDYIACGYPDLSYHGQYAWRPETEGNYRHIGIMLCAKYAGFQGSCGNAFLYLAINMHWETRSLALPKLPKGMNWELAFSTQEESTEDGEEKDALLRQVPPRSIAVYTAK